MCAIDTIFDRKDAVKYLCSAEMKAAVSVIYIYIYICDSMCQLMD